MTSLGPNNPGTIVNDDAVGTENWFNPDNAKASDDTYATVAGAAWITLYSHYLKATNFGFSIPADATIDGIKVEIERKADRNTDDNHVKDNEVKIVKADGTIGTENKADTVTTWTTTDTYITYGSASDLWGETWTAENINDVDFGVVLSILLQGGEESSPEGLVDHIRITVYYEFSNINGVQSIQGVSTIQL